MVVLRRTPALRAAADHPAVTGAAGTSVLDAQALERLRTLDPTGASRLVARVVEAYLASADRLRRQLDDGLAGGDTAAVRLAAHTLKSSSASVGALGLAETCARTEALARDQVTGAPLAAAVADLQRDLDAALDALRALPESAPR